MSLSILYFFAFLLPIFLCNAGASDVHQAKQKNPSFVTASDSRIGIVGAGPSGLHMAYLLHKLGYTNVVLFESSGSVGGRSFTVRDNKDPDGVVHLGTCYLSSDYADLRRMAEQIGYKLEEIQLPEAHIRNDLNSNAVPLNNFVFDRVKRLEPSLRPNSTVTEVLDSIKVAVTRYFNIHNEIFPSGQPSYLEFPLSQPAPNVLARINCNLQQFLETNKLMALEPYFLLGMTSMGYGSLKDTSTLYGLMWMNPSYLNDLAGAREQSKLSMLRRGYRSLWQAVGKSLDGFEIKLNSRVKHVTRTKSKVKLEFLNGNTETLDWLMWTPSMLRTSSLFSDLNQSEKRTFEKLSGRLFRTRLMRPSETSESGILPTNEAVTYYLNALESSGDINLLLAVRNSAKVLLGSQAPINGPTTLVAYYLSGYPEAKDKISYQKATGTEYSDSLYNFTFEYMHRFSVADMADGILWRILHELQGPERTWFIGNSVVFDSVKSVMKYNKMLLHLALPDKAPALLANI